MPELVPVPAAVITATLESQTKSVIESKTMLLNAAVLACATLESQLHILQPLLPVNVYAVMVVVLPVANMLLRAVTSTQIRLPVWAQRQGAGIEG